jgi:hypothetical protein
LDENRLLKHGLFWGVLVAGFWLLISVLESLLATVIGMVVWSALLYVIFYHHAQKKSPD